MKKTGAVSLIVLVIVGGLVMGVVEFVLTVSGRSIVVPPLTLAATLAIFGALIIVVAAPIRRAVTGKSLSRIDPFYALRVVVLAKASALGGALLMGAGFGVVIYLESLPVVPPSGSVLLAVATIVGAAMLLAAGLIAEFMCRIPPGRNDDDDDDRDGPGDDIVRVRS